MNHYGLILLLLYRYRIVSPMPIPTRWNIQPHAQSCKAILKAMLMNERVLHLLSLAKYAVAFFKMSRSSLTRPNSLRHCFNSSCNAFASWMSQGCCFLLNRWTHPCTVLMGMPRSLAVWSIDFDLRANCIASSWTLFQGQVKTYRPLYSVIRSVWCVLWKVFAGFKNKGCVRIRSLPS